MNIDRIAREMVDVEPSVDLEARIRARLRRDGARPSGTAAWWSWRVAALLGALAATALIIAVQVPRSLPAGAATQAVPVSAGLPAGAATQPVRVSAGLPAGAATQPVRVSAGLPAGAAPAGALAKAGPKSPSSVLSAEEIAWMNRRLPALEPVNALQMDYLRVDSIQPEPLAITPLTMTPVATDGGGIERRNDR